MKRRLVVRYIGPDAVAWGADVLGFTPDETSLRDGRCVFGIYWTKEACVDERRAEAQMHALHEKPLHRKFGAIAELFAIDPGFLEFDAFLFADDDLVPRGCTITDVFDAFERSGARIAHPGLTRDSQCSHAHLFVEEPARLAVPIDFTELQAPLFTREALLENLPEFDETVSGWGLERLWAKREREAGRDVMRLDTVLIFHGREQTGGLRSGIPAGEHYGMGEAREFCKRHNCEVLPPLVRR